MPPKLALLGRVSAKPKATSGPYSLSCFMTTFATIFRDELTIATHESSAELSKASTVKRLRWQVEALASLASMMTAIHRRVPVQVHHKSSNSKRWITKAVRGLFPPRLPWIRAPGKQATRRCPWPARRTAVVAAVASPRRLEALMHASKNHSRGDSGGGLTVATNGSRAAQLSPSKVNRTYDSKLVSREMHRLGQTPPIPCPRTPARPFSFCQRALASGFLVYTVHPVVLSGQQLVGLAPDSGPSVIQR